MDPEKVREISKLKVKIIAWNVDSLDWKSLTAEQVKSNILENVKEGSIILQHSSGSEEENLTGSVAALKDIIKTLKKEGYKFVTVPDLLDIPYKRKCDTISPMKKMYQYLCRSLAAYIYHVRRSEGDRKEEL